MPKAKRLEALLGEVEHLAIRGNPGVRISSIGSDSRLVEPEGLFVAIPGSKHDGHGYIGQAIEKGALAVVGEQALSLERIPYIQVQSSRQALAELAAAFYDHPTRKLFTVGITGTKGKTTIAHLAQSLLGPEETELISTVTNHLERGLVNTTPDPLTIQRVAHQATQAGKKSLILEVSAHGLAQDRVRGVDFDAAVFSGLSHDHLDYFKTMEDYRTTKLRLFAALKPSAAAIVNRDDPHGREFLKAAEARALTYGLSRGASIRAEALELGLERSRFLAHTPGGSTSIESALWGEFNVYNILAAIGVGIIRGLSLPEIKERIEQVNRIEGRLERFPARRGFDIVIDFAHSPDALRRVLRALRPHYRRIITVFGCGGESDRSKRPAMGRISTELSDYTIITSDNPKSESPSQIIEEIEQGIKGDNSPYEAIVDRRAAIHRALQRARPGDAVLIAGKGHERTQVFADHEEEFNDRAFLQAEGIIAP